MWGLAIDATLLLRQNGETGGVFDRLFPKAGKSHTPKTTYHVTVFNDNIVINDSCHRTIRAGDRVLHDLKTPGRWGTKLALAGALFVVADLSVRAFSSDHKGLVERVFA